MGWDAFAEPFKTKWDGPDEGDREYDVAVEAARKDRTGPNPEVIDGLLRHGGLDCSACAIALERATGENCWTEEDWSPEKTARLALSANWNQDWPAEEEWAWRSAKAFLERTAELGRGVRFSY